ncbi:MAG: hypothetical protein OXC91_12040, partial [Rhodobacteraceae bacterium]|nr:hypothetical protein [Paracoccaceae bacterium]
PYGVWEMSMRPYASLSQAPQPGFLTAIIAASGLNLHDTGQDLSLDSSRPTFLDRCPGARGDALASCLNDNRIHTSIVFNAVDQDGDGDPDILGRIANVHSIEMGGPVDADDDGLPDTYSALTGLAEVACGNGAPAGRTAGRLLITCPDVRISGRAAFGGDVSLDGALDVDGDADAWRFRAGALGGQDLTRGLFFADIVAMNTSIRITKPVCRDQGSTAQIYAAPVSYLNSSGEAILGIRARATDHNTHWSVAMTASIDRDTNSDGLADVITLTGANDHVLVLTRCS